MADAAPALTHVQQLVSEGLARAEAAWVDGRWSVRRFEAAVELPNGILGKLRDGRVRYLRGDMARRVGRALGIDWQALPERPDAPASGAVLRPVPAPAPSLPPRAAHLPPAGEHEALLEAAYDGACHRLTDVRQVEPVVAASWPLLRGADDAPDVVRVWLDVAAAIRARGGVATAEAVGVEVARELARLRGRLAATLFS
jgi:hypothetical protein